MPLTERDGVDLDVEIRRYVYEKLFTDGEFPQLSEIAARFDLAPEKARLGAKRLADAHVLVLQPVSGEILMANPFSAVPTQFVATSANRSWFANCIWDALGVAAMLHADATISTSCGCCGSSMRLEIRQEQLLPAEGIVHFALPASRWWDNIVVT